MQLQDPGRALRTDQNGYRRMFVTTRAILLRAIRHGDAKAVLTLWTERHGMCTGVTRIGVKRGASASQLLPLGRLEVIIGERLDREIQVIRELRVEIPFSRIHADPVRAALALFVQEVLYRALRSHGADHPLTGFLYEALAVLDGSDELGHFPILFLLGLADKLGFGPEPQWHEGDRFDPVEGQFVGGAVPHGHTLDEFHSAALASMLGVPIHGGHTCRLSRQTRRAMLDHLLLYFRIHLDGMGELRSPAMLHQALN